MKTLLTLSFLALSTVSFADTCFRGNVPAEYKGQISEVICVSDIDVEISREVYVESSAGLLRGYYNGPIARARKEIYNESEVCGDHLDHELSIEFLVDDKRNAIEESIKVFVITTSGFDGCHNNLKRELLEFKKI